MKKKIFDIKLDAQIWYNGEPVEASACDERHFVFSDKAILEIKEDRFILTALNEGLFRLQINIKSPFEGKGDVMVPSVWYEGNTKGEGLFPSRRIADYWHFEETRMSIPAMIVLSYPEGSLAASLSAATEEQTLADASWSLNGISFRIPSKEEPYSYRGKKSLVYTKDEIWPSFHLDKNAILTRKLNILASSEGKYETYVDFIKQFYLQDTKKPIYTWTEYQETKLTRLLNMVRRAKNGGAYLIMGEGNGEVDEVYHFTSGSFLVKSLEAAARFAQTPEEVFKRENRHLRNAVRRIQTLFNIGSTDLGKALAKLIADFFLSGECEPGCFQDCISLDTGEKGGYLGIGEHPEFKHLINARCNGEAMCAYLHLYDILKEQKYLELCKRVASFYLAHQLESGSYGRWFSKEGKSIDSNGTNGAHIGLFLVNLEKRIPCNPGLKESVDKAAAYYASLADKEQFYADTLDADCADKEAGIAILSFLLSYMENRKTRKYIKEAQKAAYFISTWIWQDESFLPPSSNLKKEGFSTRGLSAVSVAHHHLDFYGMLIAMEFLRLYRLTDDEFFHNQALILLAGSLQLIKNDDHALDRGDYFYGYQPEQINHTKWDYFSFESNMSGTYGIDIAWVNVLGYGAYLDILNNFREVLDEVQRDFTQPLEYGTSG